MRIISKSINKKRIKILALFPILLLSSCNQTTETDQKEEINNIEKVNIEITTNEAIALAKKEKSFLPYVNGASIEIENTKSEANNGLATTLKEAIESYRKNNSNYYVIGKINRINFPEFFVKGITNNYVYVDIKDELDFLISFYENLNYTFYKNGENITFTYNYSEFESDFISWLPDFSNIKLDVYIKSEWTYYYDEGGLLTRHNHTTTYKCTDDSEYKWYEEVNYNFIKAENVYIY